MTESPPPASPVPSSPAIASPITGFGSPITPTVPRRPSLSSLNSTNSFSGPPSSSSVRIPIPGKSILKKPNTSKDTGLLSRLTTRFLSTPSQSPTGEGRLLKRAHFILPEIAIVYPISSALPPSTPTLKEEIRQVEEKEKERRNKVLQENDWPMSKVESFYRECCGSPSDVDNIISKALLETADASPRTLTISGLLVGKEGVEKETQIITPLADILSVEWGLRRLIFSHTHLTSSSLKPLLHALLIPNSLTYLSLEGSSKLKSESFKFLGAFLKESKSLRFLDLSNCASLGVERKAVEWLVEGLPANGEKGLQSLKLDGVSLSVAGLETLARAVRTSGLVNISLRYNKINSSGGSVAIALMCRDWPDVVPGTPPPASPIIPASPIGSPLASPIIPPPSSNKPFGPPPKHPVQTTSVQTTYTPYVPRAKRTAAATPAATPSVVSSVQGGITARWTPPEIPKPTHPSPALLRQVRALDSLPRISSLTTLDLKSNGISSAGVGYISQVLKRNRSLKVLNLSENRIGPEGLVGLGEALKYNATLETLDLSKNPCCGPGLEGVQSLRTSFPQNNSLKRLFLSSTQFTSQSAISLAEFLPDSSSLLHLSLTSNTIDLAGVLALKSALKKNKVMRCLDLDVPIGERGAEEEHARACREILGFCVRNTEEAERARQGEQSEGDREEPTMSSALIGPPANTLPIIPKSAVWSPLESSQLIKGVMRRESLAERARTLLAQLVLLCEDPPSQPSSAFTLSQFRFTTTNTSSSTTTPKKVTEETYLKAESMLSELSRVITSSEEGGDLEELLGLHDQFGEILPKLETRLPKRGSNKPPLSVFVPGEAYSKGEREVEEAEESSTPRIDKGKAKAPAPPELVLSPTSSRLPPSPPLTPTSSTSSFEDDLGVPLDSVGFEDDKSPTDRSKIWTAEEGEIFRKGNVLLGPEEMEGEWEGEELRRELLQAQLERRPPRDSFSEDDEIPDTATSLPELEVIGLNKKASSESLVRKSSSESLNSLNGGKLPYLPRTRSSSLLSSSETTNGQLGSPKLGDVKEES